MLMETVSMESMPSSTTTTGTRRSAKRRDLEARKNKASPIAIRKSGISVRSRRSTQRHRDGDITVISNLIDEEHVDDEEAVPGAFAVGDQEERRQKGQLTELTASSMNMTRGGNMHVGQLNELTASSMNMTGGGDIHMGTYNMEEETSATGAPSEFQVEPNDKTDPNERTSWFTKREKILALVCFLLVGLPLGLGLGLGMAFDKDDGGKSESPTSAPTTLTLQNELRAKLAGLSTDGDSVFDDPGSPQNLAIEWLALDTIWQIERNTLRMETRYGLAVLYYSTQGDTWQETYEFLTDSDECTWHNGDEDHNRRGVICNEEDQVTGISLGMYLLLL
jgi:hypothetical protein